MTIETATHQRNGVERQGLFPCDAEVARRLSLGEDKFRRVVRALELQGFPRRDPLINRRYWPAIVAFWNRRYHIDSLPLPSMSDGEENLDAF